MGDFNFLCPWNGLMQLVLCLFQLDPPGINSSSCCLISRLVSCYCLCKISKGIQAVTGTVNRSACASSSSSTDNWTTAQPIWVFMLTGFMCGLLIAVGRVHRGLASKHEDTVDAYRKDSSRWIQDNFQRLSPHYQPNPKNKHIVPRHSDL